MTSLVDAEGPDTLFHPPPYLHEHAHVKDLQHYHTLYDESVNDPDTFWRTIAGEFHWETPLSSHDHVFGSSNFDVRKGPINIKFMAGSVTNICYNALDRNVEQGLGEKIAYFW